MKNTSEDVFVEFANWLEENKDRIAAWENEICIFI